MWTDIAPPHVRHLCAPGASLLFFVATPTPFDARGKVDLGHLRAHVLWLVNCGVDGFVPTGSTGEFLYLSDREREAVHRTVLDAARGMPVYPCTWDPNPTTTRYLTDAAQAQGASGVLLPPPLYYRLDDHAVEAWYRSMAPASGLPVLAYHNPGSIPTPVTPDLYARLRNDGVLAGMKDSSGDIWRVQRLSDADPGAIFAGSDRVLAEAARVRFLGGFVSALGNLWPEFCLRVFKGREEQLGEALLDRVNQVRDAGGPRAIKAALGMGCRAPLIEPDPLRVGALPPRERP
jgi:dihydrodipicolinate synthase/N-acetylneuraminate lyase